MSVSRIEVCQIMSDPSLGLFFVQALPFVTSTIGPQLSEAIGQFLEAITVVLTAHGTAEVSVRQFAAIKKGLQSYADRPVRPPENHDLQKAFYVSFLKATKIIYLARLDQLGWKPATVSWPTCLVRHVLGKLRTAPVTTLSLGPNTEKELLTARLNDLHAEISASATLSPEDLESRLPLRPDVALLNQLTLEAKNQRATSGPLIKAFIEGSRWYVDLQESLTAISEEGLLDCMGAFFAEEIKSNDRVRAIVNTEMLANTGLNLQTLITSLQDAQVWLEKIAAEVNSLKEEISNDFQKIFRVIDAEFLETHKRQTITPFLSIARGDWRLVAHGQAIERDLAAEVVRAVLQPIDRAVLQIIRGEPGCGKTTLLLQVGAKLVAAGCQVLEVLPAAPLSEFQYFARKLTKKAPGRLFILIDDIYRDEGRAVLVQVMSDLGENLPITVIASTPSFADRTNSIRESSFLEKLPPVSPDNLTDQELARLREAPVVKKLSAKRFKELTQSRKILVVMLQLSQGKPIEQILSDAADRLKRNFPDTYKAWGVIVVFNRYHLLPIPTLC